MGARPVEAGWTAVASIQRVVVPIAPVAPREPFVQSLSAHDDPRFLRPLAHIVDPDGPSGRIGGLVTPTPSPVEQVAQRTPSFVRRWAPRLLPAPVISRAVDVGDRALDDVATSERRLHQPFDPEVGHQTVEGLEPSGQPAVPGVPGATVGPAFAPIADPGVATAPLPTATVAPLAADTAIGGPTVARAFDITNQSPAPGAGPPSPEHRLHATFERIPLQAAVAGRAAVAGSVVQRSLIAAPDPEPLLRELPVVSRSMDSPDSTSPQDGLVDPSWVASPVLAASSAQVTVPDSAPTLDSQEEPPAPSRAHAPDVPSRADGPYAAIAVAMPAPPAVPYPSGSSATALPALQRDVAAAPPHVTNEPADHSVPAQRRLGLGAPLEYGSPTVSVADSVSVSEWAAARYEANPLQRAAGAPSSDAAGSASATRPAPMHVEQSSAQAPPRSAGERPPDAVQRNRVVDWVQRDVGVEPIRPGLGMPVRRSVDVERPERDGGDAPAHRSAAAEPVLRDVGIETIQPSLAVDQATGNVPVEVVQRAAAGSSTSPRHASTPVFPTARDGLLSPEHDETGKPLVQRQVGASPVLSTTPVIARGLTQPTTPQPITRPVSQSAADVAPAWVPDADQQPMRLGAPDPWVADAPDAGSYAVATGVAQRVADGSVVFNSPSTLSADATFVQREDASASADHGSSAEVPAPTSTDAPPPVGPTAVTAPALAGAAPNIEALARRLYDPLAARLKAELRLDRERAGLVTDLRRS